MIDTNATPEKLVIATVCKITISHQRYTLKLITDMCTVTGQRLIINQRNSSHNIRDT